MRQLTGREREIAHLIAAGLTTNQIAEKCIISPTTVKTHVVAIKYKLGVEKRRQISVRLLRELGI